MSGLELLRDSLIEQVGSLKDGPDLHVALGSWLNVDTPGDVERAGESAASRNGGARSYRDVAVLGFLLPRFDQHGGAFRSGLGWLANRRYFVPGVGPSLEADGVAMFGIAAGVRELNIEASWLGAVARRTLELAPHAWSRGWALSTLLLLDEIDSTVPVGLPPAMAVVLSDFGISFSSSDIDEGAIYSLVHGGPDRALVTLAALRVLAGREGIVATDQTKQPDGPGADVLLVVVTDRELDALIEEVSRVTDHGEPAVLHHAHRSYYDLGTIGKARVLAVQCEMGSSGPGGAATTVMTAIREVKPRTVMMVGIAFGVDEDKQPIGHVLVSKQIQNYAPSKQTRSGDVLPRGDRATATPRVLSRLRTARRRVREHFTVEFGLMLSGEVLIDNLSFRQRLEEREPEAIGGEMEGAGLYAAVVEGGVDWCVVKGVCDYADGNKSKDKATRQDLAATNAARLVVTALADGGFATT